MFLQCTGKILLPSFVLLLIQQIAASLQHLQMKDFTGGSRKRCFLLILLPTSGRANDGSESNLHIIQSLTALQRRRPAKNRKCLCAVLTVSEPRSLSLPYIYAVPRSPLLLTATVTHSFSCQPTFLPFSLLALPLQRQEGGTEVFPAIVGDDE